jgi:hypothetical protein
LFRSSDGGNTWTSLGSPLTFEGYDDASVLVPDPVLETVLWAGCPHLGVLCSPDNGQTWQAWGNPKGSVMSLAIDPTTGRVLYAGMEADYAWRCELAREMEDDPSHGWTCIQTLTPNTEQIVRVTALAVDPVSPSTVYAGVVRMDVYNAWCLQLQKSTDSGNTWTGACSQETGGYSFISSIAIDPNDHTKVYAATLGQGVLGAVPQSGLQGSSLWVNQIVFGGANSNRLYAATDAGVYSISFGQAPPRKHVVRRHLNAIRP